MLAEAWSRIRPQGWRMVVVGPDENGHRAEVIDLVHRLGLSNDWEFRDQAFGEAKWRCLAEADLLILPTYSENFGNVVPESLLVETPVVTTTGAPWEGLLTHSCGWWVSPTVEGLKQALTSAFSKSSDELREMGKRGRDWALQSFDWSTLAAKMIEVYQWALKERQSPKCAH